MRIHRSFCTAALVAVTISSAAFAQTTYTWNVNGTISPPNLFFTLVYTGTNAGYTANMFGTVDASGAPLSGTGTSSEGQTFSWSALRKP